MQNIKRGKGHNIPGIISGHEQTTVSYTPLHVYIHTCDTATPINVHGSLSACGMSKAMNVHGYMSACDTSKPMNVHISGH
jgi:hypothetical protein